MIEKQDSISDEVKENPMKGEVTDKIPAKYRKPLIFVIRVLPKFIIKKIAKYALNRMYKINIYGLENIPKTGKAILCSNHIHLLDSVTIKTMIKREVIFVAKKEHWEEKILQVLLDKFDTIPVDRKKVGIEFFRTVKKFLKKGKIVGIFPEGTRLGQEKGEKVHDGAAYLAISNKAPVIVVKVEGNFDELHSEIDVIIGELLYLTGKTRDEGTETIMSTINSLKISEEQLLKVKKKEKKIYLKKRAYE